MSSQAHFVAAVLAAGQSQRMAQPKQLLPWGKTTVLGQTLRHVQQSQVQSVLVITGHEAEAVTAIASAAAVPTFYNPAYALGEMLSSLKVAVSNLPAGTTGLLVILADQPMIEPETLNQIMAAFRPGLAEIVVPTFQGQRGNPVLIGRRYFDELLQLPAGAAPRDLLKRHSLYLLEVNTPTILYDLDRPEDYQTYRPKDT